MPKKIRKGMVLCAGLGTRLLPITDRYPKPVVPILNIPNLLHSLFLLEKAGIESVVLNLHHIPLKIENFIKNTPKLRMKVSFSKETALLGTGGGVKKAETFFEGEPFVLVNCDFVSNISLEPYLEKHFERRALATMILHEDPETQAQYSKVGVDREEHLCSLPKLETSAPKRTGIFTGIHILSNDIFKWLKEEPSGINDVLYPALMQQHPQRVYADFTKNNYWYDTGDLPALSRATGKLLDSLQEHDGLLLELLKSHGHDYVEKAPGIFVSEAEGLPDATRVTLKPPVLIGPRCQFAKGVVIGPYCAVGEESLLAEGFKAKHSVLLAGSKTKAGFEIKDAIWFQDNALSPEEVMSDFFDKLSRGEIPTALDWDEHLKAAHQKAPSMTPHAFADYRSVDGLTSYEHLARLAGPAKAVLDLACGDGCLVPLLRAHSEKVVGIDMSEAELSLARRQHAGRATFVLGKAEALPFDDGEFGAVVCHMAIMLIAPVEPVIAEISRVLIRGGVFAAVVGNPKGAIGVQLEIQKAIHGYLQAAFPGIGQAPAGDPRTANAEGIRELFVTSGKFTAVMEVTPFYVVKRVPPAGVWDLLKNMYFLSMLPPARNAALRREVEEIAAQHAGPDGKLDYRFPLLQFRVVK